MIRSMCHTKVIDRTTCGPQDLNLTLLVQGVTGEKLDSRTIDTWVLLLMTPARSNGTPGRLLPGKDTFFPTASLRNRLRGCSLRTFYVVKMLAMVVFVFATLWLPYRGMLVYNSFAMLFSRKRFMDLWFLMFAKTCIYINWYANSGVLATPKDSGDLCLNSVGKLQEKHD
uniref:Uncharacterized protein n=1 Tax=Timema poppense TaxID=170557 RepID=A0A7R9CXF8_TIMPO|nr:unnamed protein product [Timema poppensis]